MKKPNTLLKVVSILYIVFSIISGVLILLSFLGLGALVGGVAGSVGAGMGIALVLALFSLIGVVLGLIAGLVGLKAENLPLCKGLAITLVVLAAISLISNLFSGNNISSSLVGLVLPILYLSLIHISM